MLKLWFSILWSQIHPDTPWPNYGVDRAAKTFVDGETIQGVRSALSSLILNGKVPVNSEPHSVKTASKLAVGGEDLVSKLDAI